jgi:hypothetical protein
MSFQHDNGNAIKVVLESDDKKDAEKQSFLSCSSASTPNNQGVISAKAEVSFNPAFPCNVAKRPYLMGIDPGLNGAVAILDTSESLKIVTVFDIPTYELKVKGNKRKRTDIISLAFKIDSYSQLIKLALIEEVGQIGTKADPFSSFVFGFATGAVHGVLNACLIPVQTIRPDVWKASLGLSADKNKSIEKAKRLVTGSEEFLTLKKHDGRAEAILLAYLAYKHLGEKK